MRRRTVMIVDAAVQQKDAIVAERIAACMGAALEMCLVAVGTDTKR
jgi:hypothetical protein